MFDVTQFRNEFPFFTLNPNVVYLDSAATTLKPEILIEATSQFYCSSGSVHRSQSDAENTQKFEQARQSVCNFIHSESPDCIIWTSGTTHSINLVANGLRHQLCAKDEIIISEGEHHANFVTWQQLALQTGAKLHIVELNDEGLITVENLQPILSEKTKIVALQIVSNVTGTQQSIEKLIPIIRQHSSAKILLDGAQAISHIPLNVKQLDCDYFVFSAHKIYGPTGLGVLTGKFESLEQLQPLFFGGKMVERVSKEKTTFAPLPYRLEAGTPNIAGVLGFNAVLHWLQQWDFIAAEQHSIDLAQYCQTKLASQYPQCRLYPSAQASTFVCFTFDGIASADLSTLLAEQNIAIRAGKHCAEPYLNYLQQNATLRLSFAPYNTMQDVERFFQALDKALELLC